MDVVVGAHLAVEKEESDKMLVVVLGIQVGEGLEIAYIVAAVPSVVVEDAAAPFAEGWESSFADVVGPAWDFSVIAAVVEGKACYACWAVMPAVFDIDPIVKAAHLAVADDVDNAVGIEDADDVVVNEDSMNAVAEYFVEAVVVMALDDLVVASNLDVHVEDVAVNEEAMNLVAYDSVVEDVFFQHWRVSVDDLFHDERDDLLLLFAALAEGSWDQNEMLNPDYLLFSFS